MTLRGVTVRRLAWGLAIALLVAAGVSRWLESTALAGLRESFARRGAVIVLGAAVDLVERMGIESEALPEAVAAFDESQPEIEAVRVIRFQGIRLLASSASGDTGDQAAPRRLSKDEKALYDLGQTLRANIDSNLEEGRQWKDEIDIVRVESGALSMAAPLEEEGVVVGAVLIEATPVPVDIPAAGWLAPIALVLLPVLAFLGLATLLKERRSAQLLLAIGILAAALYGIAYRTQGFLGSGLVTGGRSLAARLESESGLLADVLRAQGAPAEGLAPYRWDMDRYRQPLGRQTEGGPDEAGMRSALAEELGSFRRLMSLTGFGALLLLSYIGFGWAATTWGYLSKHRVAYVYVLPAMATMILLVFFPFFYGVALSFTNQNIYNTDQPLTEIWSGLQNYEDILGDLDLVQTAEDGTRVVDYANFFWTLGFTVVWTVTNVALGVSVGLFLALVLNTRGLALRPMYRVLLILPWAMPNYITALIWKGMFHSQFGVINQVIQMFGGEARSWFDTPFTAFITVLSTNAWLSFPFMMVISLGALQSIPSDLYEAARVDGASRWQQFRSITLPSLKPALVPAVIISVIWTFNQFNVIYLVSEGEPGGATEILITEAYKIAFEQYRYGYAAAYSVVIFLILLAYGVWQNKVTGATEGI